MIRLQETTEVARPIVREYEPPKRVVLEGKGESIPALDDIRFASAPGSTRITYTTDISMLGALSCAERWLKGPLDRVRLDTLEIAQRDR